METIKAEQTITKKGTHTGKKIRDRIGSKTKTENQGTGDIEGRIKNQINRKWKQERTNTYRESQRITGDTKDFHNTYLWKSWVNEVDLSGFKESCWWSPRWKMLQNSIKTHQSTDGQIMLYITAKLLRSGQSPKIGLMALTVVGAVGFKTQVCI